jgi:uncharacterized membrane protein
MLRRFLSPAPSSSRTEPWTLRGLSPGRLENFSDCTFSFALTLLVITLEVPKTYDDLLRILPGFFSFAACFAVLSVLWHRHVLYFRRYGLSDGPTIALNVALLSLVLFYLYPLKFMMNSMNDLIARAAAKLTGSPVQGPPLATVSATATRSLAVYLFGLAGVSLAFSLLYRHALRRRGELKLSEFEETATRDDMVLWFVSTLCAGVGAAWFQWAPLPIASWGSAFIVGIALTRRVQRRRRRALLESASPANP